MDTEYAHVLIVEDTDAVREVFARQLEVLGVKADVAANGAEALTMFVKRPYLFVITDFSMPHMNGQELVARFRRIEADRMLPDRTVYVLLSADDKRLEALESGFDDVLLKPVSLNDLRQLMIKWKVPAQISGQGSASGQIDDTPLDLDVIREQMGDIDDIALAMLARFPEMMEPILDKLLMALEKKDFVSAAVYAHSLKGAARSAGAVRFGRKLAGLQARAEAGESFPVATGDELLKEFHDVQSAVSALCH